MTRNEVLVRDPRGRGEVMEIVRHPETGVFLLMCDGKVIAESISSRALSQFAFDHGANTVHFDFDLKHEQ